MYIEYSSYNSCTLSRSDYTIVSILFVNVITICKYLFDRTRVRSSLIYIFMLIASLNLHKHDHITFIGEIELGTYEKSPCTFCYY